MSAIKPRSSSNISITSVINKQDDARLPEGFILHEDVLDELLELLLGAIEVGVLILHIFPEIISVSVATAIIDRLGTVKILTDTSMDMGTTHVREVTAIVRILSGKDQKGKIGMVDDKLPEFIRSVEQASGLTFI